MKIWKWYKKPTTEQRAQSENLSIEDKYPLYAFTTNKEYRDLWRQMRKKDCFIEISSKITKEEYTEFANNYNGCMLDLYKYKRFRGYNSSGTIDFDDIELLTTWTEKEFTDSLLESFSDSQSGMECVRYPFPPMVFSEKYFRALNTLQYVNLWRLYRSDFYQYEDETETEMLQSLGIDMDYAAPDIDYDEFNAFVSIYGEYLKR